MRVDSLFCNPFKNEIKLIILQCYAAFSHFPPAATVIHQLSLESNFNQIHGALAVASTQQPCQLERCVLKQHIHSYLEFSSPLSLLSTIASLYQNSFKVTGCVFPRGASMSEISISRVLLSNGEKDVVCLLSSC